LRRLARFFVLFGLYQAPVALLFFTERAIAYYRHRDLMMKPVGSWLGLMPTIEDPRLAHYVRVLWEAPPDFAVAISALSFILIGFILAVIANRPERARPEPKPVTEPDEDW
jgi:hypothetical protein